MDVWDYFEERQREFERFSLVQNPSLPSDYRALDGSSDSRGRVLARLDLNDRAFISVMELVEIIDGSHVRRVEYSYFLIVDGEEVYGRERDPSHHPAEHGHGRDHARVAAGRVTFSEFATRAWEIVSDLEPLDP